MRWMKTLKNDMRYQTKYGFYFIYVVVSAVYVAVLLLCPQEYRGKVASLIILSDPAMLGSFFIGGIWLLEQDEGLHQYWGISPLRPLEYILSKAVSLAVVSVLSAVAIVLVGMPGGVQYGFFIPGVFFSAITFTVIGLLVATYARSLNHYIMIVMPIEIIIVLPPVFAVFGLSHPALSILPGMASWQWIGYSVGATTQSSAMTITILCIWMAVALALAGKRMPFAMQNEKGIQL